MTDIFTIIARLKRLPRQHRIAHLRSLIAQELPRSQRRADLEAVLKKEIIAQLKHENRAA